MCTNFLEKIRVLLIVILSIKNWYLFVAIYFRLLTTDYATLEMRNGIKIRLRVDSTDLMAFINVWILHDYGKSGLIIDNDDIVIDIGAHIGLFALFSAQLCKNGRIYCFEPVKENFDLLKSNIELNNVQNVTIINTAVSAENGVVSMYLNNDDAGHSMHVRGAKKIDVKSISLKSIFDIYNLKRCDFLKIDCEGEEYNIIDSLSNNYFDKIAKISLEYHFANVKPHLLENLVKKLEPHYKINTVSGLSGMGYLYARNKSS